MNHFIKIISLSCIAIFSAQGIEEIQILASTQQISETSRALSRFMDMNIRKYNAHMITQEAFTICMRYEWEIFKTIMQEQHNPDMKDTLISIFWHSFKAHLKELEHFCRTLPVATNPWLQATYQELAPIYDTYFAENRSIDQRDRYEAKDRFNYFGIRFTPGFDW